MPFPDLDRPLDFSPLKKNGARDMKAWSAQFREETNEAALSLADLGEGHMVLARRNADVSELRS